MSMFQRLRNLFRGNATSSDTPEVTSIPVTHIHKNILVPVPPTKKVPLEDMVNSFLSLPTSEWSNLIKNFEPTPIVEKPLDKEKMTSTAFLQGITGFEVWIMPVSYLGNYNKVTAVSSLIALIYKDPKKNNDYRVAQFISTPCPEGHIPNKGNVPVYSYPSDKQNSPIIPVLSALIGIKHLLETQVFAVSKIRVPAQAIPVLNTYLKDTELLPLQDRLPHKLQYPSLATFKNRLKSYSSKTFTVLDENALTAIAKELAPLLTLRSVLRSPTTALAQVPEGLIMEQATISELQPYIVSNGVPLESIKEPTTNLPAWNEFNPPSLVGKLNAFFIAPSTPLHAAYLARCTQDPALSATITELSTRTSWVLTLFETASEETFDEITTFLNNLFLNLVISNAVVTLPSSTTLTNIYQLNQAAKLLATRMGKLNWKQEEFFRIKRIPEKYCPILVLKYVRSTYSASDVSEHISQFTHYLTHIEEALSTHETHHNRYGDHLKSEVKHLYATPNSK